MPVSTFVESVPGGSSSGQSGTAGSGGTDQVAVNPMLVTTWLRSTGADVPLLLQTDQATVIDGPPSGFTTMSDIYFQLLEFAQTLATTGQDELNQMLMWAKEALPSTSPDTFPLATEPSDWPMPDTTYWNNFSFTSTSTTSSPGQPGQATATQPASLPSVWSLREAVVARPAAAQAATAQPASTAQPAASTSPVSAIASQDEVASTGVERTRIPEEIAVDETSTPADSVAAAPRAPVAEAVASSAPASPVTSQSAAAASSIAQVARSEPVAMERPVFLDGLGATPVYGRPLPVGPPPVQTSATQITLEHMIVTIDRSSWWQNDWLVDPEWYVPDTPQGNFIGAAPGTNQVWGLAVALILVRNLTLTGSWSSQDTTQLTSGQILLGPFNLGGATTTTNADSTVSISVAGPTVLALFCQPLFELPPSAPPANGSSGSGASGQQGTQGSTGSSGDSGSDSDPPPADGSGSGSGTTPGGSGTTSSSGGSPPSSGGTEGTTSSGSGSGSDPPPADGSGSGTTPGGSGTTSSSGGSPPSSGGTEGTTSSGSGSGSDPPPADGSGSGSGTTPGGSGTTSSSGGSPPSSGGT